MPFGGRIGFIGWGIMGRSMASHLVKSGASVSVYARRKELHKEVTDVGAHPVQSPKELGEICERVLLCVSDGDAVKECLLGSDGVSTGDTRTRLIIDHSTIAPSEARELHAILHPLGINFVDAPVTGGDKGARDGTLTVMVGCADENFEAIKTTVQPFSKSVVRTGEVGSGQLTKCVNQVMVAISIAAMTEGLLFAKHSGLDLRKTMEIVGSGAAGSWAITNYGPRLLTGDLKPGFSAKHMLKDLRIVQSEAKSLNLSLPALDLVTTIYTKLANLTPEELGNHALIRAYE